MEARVTNLEIKFSHLDEFLMELNKVVIEQQKRIERLEKEILDQRSVIESLDGGAEALSLKNSKPPHY